MRIHLIIISFILFSFQLGFGQNPSDSDILIFKYDDSYLTVFKHTPDCYYIADIPIGNGFCFRFEKEVKTLSSEKVLDMRNYVYKFNRKHSGHRIATFIDIDTFVKHFGRKHIYLKKENTYIKVSPSVYID